MGKGELRLIDSGIEQMHFVRLRMLNLDGKVRQLCQLLHRHDGLLRWLLIFSFPSAAA